MVSIPISKLCLLIGRQSLSKVPVEYSSHLNPFHVLIHTSEAIYSTRISRKIPEIMDPMMRKVTGPRWHPAIPFGDIDVVSGRHGGTDISKGHPFFTIQPAQGNTSSQHFEQVADKWMSGPWSGEEVSQNQMPNISPPSNQSAKVRGSNANNVVGSPYPIVFPIRLWTVFAAPFVPMQNHLLHLEVSCWAEDTRSMGVHLRRLAKVVDFRRDIAWLRIVLNGEDSLVGLFTHRPRYSITRLKVTNPRSTNNGGIPWSFPEEGRESLSGRSLENLFGTPWDDTQPLSIWLSIDDTGYRPRCWDYTFTSCWTAVDRIRSMRGIRIPGPKGLISSLSSGNGFGEGGMEHSVSLRVSTKRAKWCRTMSFWIGVLVTHQWYEVQHSPNMWPTAGWHRSISLWTWKVILEERCCFRLQPKWKEVVWGHNNAKSSPRLILHHLEVDHFPRKHGRQIDQIEI